MIKTKTFSLPLLTLLCITAFYFTSCKPDEQSPCSDASNTIVNLTAIELNKVPYTGFDTLYFLSKTGDTNIVVGGGKQYYYDTKYSTQPPDCPQNQSTQYQAYKINFTPTKGDLNFSIIQREIKYSIYINVNKYPFSFSAETGSIGVKITNSIYQYFDSLTINNYKYDKVLVFLAQDTTYKLYMNQPNGILFIRSLKDNEEYSIMKK